MSAKFENAGQMCIAPNRIYVHSSLLETFLERLTSLVQKLTVGSGLDPASDVGPLINDAAVAKVETHVMDAIDKGARLLVGGHRLDRGAHAGGSFYAPTVLANVTEDMLVAREETFGPVAPVIAFEEEDEVVERANSTEYGLAAYIYTDDMKKAMRIAEKLEYGLVGVNDTRIAPAEGAFGGFKQSGIGREGGREGLASFLETKQVVFGV
jgi:succinate-semialdehyde dehydrogenase/glutarate-semialdehyde dehydrogenase